MFVKYICFKCYEVLVCFAYHMASFSPLFLFCYVFSAHTSGASSPFGKDLSPELYTVAKVSLLLFQMVWDLTVNGSSAMFLPFHESSCL